ncbi:unnamed protein product [Lasius platythorax]|uniref:Uncharacterized protein n=1 Tax=Lasius platythorax TaxID=488582 RepID=A0AAV2NTW9_9HYME
MKGGRTAQRAAGEIIRSKTQPHNTRGSEITPSRYRGKFKVNDTLLFFKSCRRAELSVQPRKWELRKDVEEVSIYADDGDVSFARLFRSSTTSDATYLKLRATG